LEEINLTKEVIGQIWMILWEELINKQGVQEEFKVELIERKEVKETPQEVTEL